MNARSGVAVLSIVGLGVLSSACAAAAGPMPEAESSSSPTGVTTVSWLRVTPERGVPNSEVSLDVACLDSLGAMHSPVLDIGPLNADPEGHQPWHLFGTATVRPAAAPGRYRIFSTCGASELSTDFTVVAPSR
jgi:hypothetical protein